MHTIPKAALPLLACGTAFALLAGCTAETTASSTEASSAAAPSGTLSKPITLKYDAEVLADNDDDRVLVSGDEKVVAVSAEGKELWSQKAYMNTKRPEAMTAFTHGDNVIVDDSKGLRAFNWKDGREVWKYTPTAKDLGCETGAYYNSTSSTGGKTIGDNGVVLLEYWLQEDSGANCKSSDAKAMALAIDPATGKLAWPAVQAPVDAYSMERDFLLQVTPDHKHAYLPWRDKKGSYLSRIDLASGKHATLDLSKHSDRSLGFSAYPQQKPGTLVYAFGDPDPEEHEPGKKLRTASLTVPTNLPEDTGTLKPLSTKDHPDIAKGITFDDSEAERCAARPAQTAKGTQVCAMSQLIGTRSLLFGSTLNGKSWSTDLAEDALNSSLFIDGATGNPSVPVDGPDSPLLIMPGLEAGVRAADATTGKTVWESGDDVQPGNSGDGSYGFGGNGAFQQAGLIPVLLNGAVHFFTFDGKEKVDAHDIGTGGGASATGRWFAVSNGGDDDGNYTTTLWTVTGG